MTTYRVRYGKDADGVEAWVLDESGSRIEAFLTKDQAVSRAQKVAQKEAALSSKPSKLVIETKDGRVSDRRTVEEGDHGNGGFNVPGL